MVLAGTLLTIGVAVGVEDLAPKAHAVVEPTLAVAAHVEGVWAVKRVGRIVDRDAWGWTWDGGEGACGDHGEGEGKHGELHCRVLCVFE